MALGISAASPSAHAGDKKPAASATKPTLGADGVRRDPAGLKGVSPYNEQLGKARKLFQNKDMEGAMAAFQDAVKLDPKNMLGYLLVAQMQITKGDVEAAKKTLAEARDKDGTEPVRAKYLFLASDMSERAIPGIPSKPTLDVLQPPLDAAKQAWEAYSAYAAEHTKAPDYRASATERKKRLDGRADLEKAYIPVKQRIAERNKERAAEAEKAAAAEAAKSR
jgi:tetratricopeptide (TPR) repeat protein